MLLLLLVTFFINCYVGNSSYVLKFIFVNMKYILPDHANTVLTLLLYFCRLSTE